MDLNRRKSLGLMGALALGASSFPNQAFGGLFGRCRARRIHQAQAQFSPSLSVPSYHAGSFPNGHGAPLSFKGAIVYPDPKPTCQFNGTSFDDDPDMCDVLVGHDFIVNLWVVNLNPAGYTVTFSEGAFPSGGTTYNFNWSPATVIGTCTNSSSGFVGIQVRTKVTIAPNPNPGLTIGSSGLTISINNNGWGNCVTPMNYIINHHT